MKGKEEGKKKGSKKQTLGFFRHAVYMLKMHGSTVQRFASLEDMEIV
jgi:hypothetical protein